MTYKCPFLAATCINVSSLEVSYYEIILKYSSSVNPSSYITGLDLVFYMLSIFNIALSNISKYGSVSGLYGKKLTSFNSFIYLGYALKNVLYI